MLLGPDGRIAAVGPDADVPRPAGVPAEDFGSALLLPGLINTHTHLELTGMAGGSPEADFASWIRGVREAKALLPADRFLVAARQGLADCWAAGVTTVADTGDSGAVAQALAEVDGSGIAYQEVFGPHPDQWDESLRGLQRRVESLSPYARGRVRLGVSPHAPYSVSGRLYQATAEWARAEALPLAVHVAESPAESALLARGSGAFAVAWRGREIPDARAARPKPDSVARRARRAVTAHALHSRGSGPRARHRSSRERRCGRGALPALEPGSRPRRGSASRTPRCTRCESASAPTRW